jgi:pantetheine-phosphate adenylyltransferase
VKRAIYPGTFDPITLGHLDIIKRACKIFDEVIIAVAQNKDKKPMFSYEQRVHLVKKATTNLPKVKVVGFEGLLVDLSDKLKANTIIRGLRAVSDFEYELQMGYANASLKEELETIYLMPSLQYAFISSSIVRAILSHGGKIEHLVPKEILEDLKCM